MKKFQFLPNKQLKLIVLIYLCLFGGLTAVGQITFKLKSIVSNQNPSTNGLFSYGTLDGANNFSLFPFYGSDGTGSIPQMVWTYQLGVHSYPALAFEQLNATEITPQPFPPFGVFFHPGWEQATVLKLAVPQQMQIVSIVSKVQRATFDCGENIGYSIQTASGTVIQPRVVVATSDTPSIFNALPTTVNAGDFVYFKVDRGDDGSNYCDDTAVDVEITMLPTKITKPTLTGTLNCRTTTATFDIAYQQSGTLELYKLGNPSPIAITSINQVGVTFNGQGIFTGLNLTNGQYYVIAKNAGQQPSEKSDLITLSDCCTDGIANPIQVNNSTICEGEIATLTATGCNGTVTWSNGFTGTITTVAKAGTYTATCTVLPSGSPCTAGTSTAISTVTVHAKPSLRIISTVCSPDLITYDVNYTSNGVVTTSAGVVDKINQQIKNILSGTDIQVTATNLQGCLVSQIVNTPDCHCPTVNAPISGGDKSICEGESIPVLTVNVGTNETADWYDANGILIASTTKSYTPNVAGIYYVQARNTINNCVSATKTKITLTINDLPNLTIDSKVCSANLLTYTIGFTSNGAVKSNIGTITDNSVVSIPKGTNAILTATNTKECTTSLTVIAPDCHCPTVNAPISGGDKSICQGEVIPALSVSVGEHETVNWYDAPTDGNLVATGLSYTPTAGGLYYAETQNTIQNCKSKTRTVVRLIINSVGAKPIFVSTKNPLVLGESTTLSVTNCNGTIKWSTGEQTPNISISPSETTSYSAQCVSLSGCISGISEIQIVVTPPKVTATAKANEVCIGGSSMLHLAGCPSGATIYWTSPYFGTGQSLSGNDVVLNNLSQSATYTGNCQTSAGLVTADVTIQVNQAQDFTIISSKNPIILGELVQLTAKGCDGIVSWQNGQVQGNPITVYPNEKTTTYTAECLSPTSCGGKGTITIEVKPPQIAVTGKDVCYGASPTLSAEGCHNGVYEWLVWHKEDYSDVRHINNPSSYAITQKTYFRAVCGTQVGETSGDILINPVSLPNKPAIGSPQTTYYVGEKVTIGSSCDARTLWSNGATSTHIDVYPTQAENTYVVRCINDATGCENSNSITIYMKTPPPQVTDMTLCYGDTLKLQSGCRAGTTGSWTKNWLDIPNRISLKEGYKEPLTQSTNYAVSCYHPQTGYSDPVVMYVTVNPAIQAPSITAKDTMIVNGDSLVLKTNGCKNTQWLDPQNNFLADTFNQITIKPTQTSVFKARCVENGCLSKWSIFKVSVRPKKPVVKTTGDTLCLGSSTTITTQRCENGAKFYWLDSSITTTSFSITPKKDTTFQSYCMSIDSLVSDIQTTYIKVYPTPQKPMIVGNLVILEKESTVLTASGCEESVQWNTGQTTPAITVSPEKNTTYTARCGVWNCLSDTASVVVRVRPRPIEIETNGNGSRGFDIADTLCLDKSLTLTALTSCNGQLIWNTGQTGNRLIVLGNISKTYSVYCFTADKEKSDESIATVTVIDYDISNAVVYPNPTAEKLHIKSKGCIDGVKVALFTQRGEQITIRSVEHHLDTLILDLYHLPSETYILWIYGTDTNGKATILKKRIIKINEND